MILIIVAVVVGSMVLGGGIIALMTGPAWPLWERGPLERQHQRPDYEHINKLELELGLGLSDYTAQGVNGSAMLAQEAEEKFREFERASEEIADQLEPDRVVKREIASAFACPAHILGRSDKSVDEIAAELENEVRRNIGQGISRSTAILVRAIAHNVAEATVNGRASTVIRPLDEPYPVTIIQPGEVVLPRLALDAQAPRGSESVY